MELFDKDYGDFVVSWEKYITVEEQSFALKALKEIVPRLTQWRETIFEADKEKIRISVRIQYPYELTEPRLVFDLWYDEVAKGYGLHFYKGEAQLAGRPLGSVHFHHQKNWL